jgi:pyruvate/2-oxoglutarate dehydrogenase complex dihydrolipoamide acyltransferase (E2) component
VHRVAGGEAGLVRAPAPAMVISLPVAAGDLVAAGDPVAIVESMKLETALRAPVAGRVHELLVAPNTQVEAGTKLVRIAPEGDGAAEGERADLAALAAGGDDGDPGAVAADALAALRWQVLASISTRPRPGRCWRASRTPAAGCPATTRRPWPVRSPSCGSSPTCARCPATAAARTTPTAPPTSPRTTRRSTCTRSCAPGTRGPRACRRRSRSGCTVRWPTTG